MAKNMKGITIDFFNNSINMSAAFAKKAEKYGSPEYLELVDARRSFPDADIIVAEKNTSKKRLTIAEMKKMIELSDDRDELSKEFERIRKVAEHTSRMPYTEVWNWFKGNIEVVRDKETHVLTGVVNKKKKPESTDKNNIVQMPQAINENEAVASTVKVDNGAEQKEKAS